MIRSYFKELCNVQFRHFANRMRKICMCIRAGCTFANRERIPGNVNSHSGIFKGKLLFDKVEEMRDAISFDSKSNCFVNIFNV